MDVTELDIQGAKLLTPKRFRDRRGFFEQTYHAKQYSQAGIAEAFVQDNWSRSAMGTLRGLHYQLEQPQAKLVAVVHGAIFDVVVDIRRGSPTFGKWTGAILSEENGRQMFAPAGTAHGFLVVSQTADVTYKCSDFYAPGDEYAIRWDDQSLAIAWPRPAAPLVISAKDRKAQPLADIPRQNLPQWNGNS